MRACMRLLCVPQVRTAAVLSACLKYRCESADPGVRNAASGKLVMGGCAASANTGPASHLPTLCQSSCFSWESCNYRGRHTDCARCAPASVCGALTARSLPPAGRQRAPTAARRAGWARRRRRGAPPARAARCLLNERSLRAPTARACRVRERRGRAHLELRCVGLVQQSAQRGVCALWSAPRWRKRRLAAVAAVGRCESVMADAHRVAESAERFSQEPP